MSATIDTVEYKLNRNRLPPARYYKPKTKSSSAIDGSVDIIRIIIRIYNKSIRLIIKM